LASDLKGLRQVKEGVASGVGEEEVEAAQAHKEQRRDKQAIPSAGDRRARRRLQEAVASAAKEAVGEPAAKEMRVPAGTGGAEDKA